MRMKLSSVLALAAALLLAACNSNNVKFSIVSGSENTVLEPIVQEFCAKQGATCTISYQGSLDIGLGLQKPEGLDQDAVWPASSVWVDLFDSGRKVRNLTSIAQMPVILGVRKSKAAELGWIGKQVYMKDILAAVKDGKLKFLMTSATQSNSGASAYLAMLSSALGGKQVIEPGDLDNASVHDTVSALLQGVERSSGSSGWLADLYVDSARKGTLYDAMWNYEATLKETNDKLKQMGDEPLYAVYPADGVAVGDSPLGFIDHGRGADVEKFFTDLLAYLQSDAVRKRIADTGRRLPLGGAAIQATAEPDWNFDPGKLVTSIRMPEPAVIRTALNLYQEALRKPSLTALCFDFSGSMENEGEKQLQAAAQFLFTPEKSSEVLVQWTPSDHIFVLPFDSTVREVFDATGDPAGQNQLLGDVAQQRAGGGTDMYACASQALQKILATPDLSKYLPAIVIMTDGRTDGSVEPFLAEWRQAPVRVPVFGITFGDADKSQLDSLAKATSARVFDGSGDLAGAFRAARGYN
ncbi:substrate-binding domain-containing protein [Mesorhizobium sp. GbtcB19]|uniref:substrate-binding domain-containing protein n=1 Tax=Mesorhizobium sp. GbtcB19 TaxID=2824764 RepID=UPI001C2F70CC|nr:substrate-binding domain-containing protein [Mesorhizobium sp. GbtcB19]